MFACIQKFQKQDSNVNFLKNTVSGVKERHHIRCTYIKLNLSLLNENYEIQ